MAGKDLKKAKKLLKRKRFSDVIRMLEPQVFRFRQNSEYYYILGTAYLHTGDVSGAATYLKRVVQLKPGHINALLELAAIYLKQGENQKAIETWLDVLQLDSSNKIARKSLDMLKESASDPAILESYLSTNKFYQLLPSEGSSIRIIIPIIVIVIFLIPLGLYLSSNFDEVFDTYEPRNMDVAEIDIGKNEKIVSVSGDFRYVLTEQEITDTLQDAKKAFDNFEDNKAQKLINKIKYSNASRQVKDKATIIEAYISTPDFTNFTTGYSYREISEDPLLYENCYVRWKGKVSNLEIGDDYIRFDFLVGYHDNKVLEGIIPVRFGFAVSIDNGEAVELIGQIKEPLKALRLKGISIRPLGSP
jgi:tetratricopeptide (TPR) repeat protein